jgi:hypothetical protein
MNLMKLAFWRDTKEEAGNTKDENKAVGNVINFPETKDQENKDLEKIFPTVYTWKYKGLLDLDEMQIFLDETYYKYGYNNGYNFQTLEALERGRDEIIFNFKNTLEAIHGQKIRYIDEVEIRKSYIEGTYKSVSNMLDSICERVKKEIEVIENQIGLSSTNKGWVEEALNKYTRGFHNGLQEAVKHQFLPHQIKGE